MRGGQVGAHNATLSIMVGGPADLFHEMLLVFEVMGKIVTHCGPNGAGQIVKACNQIQATLNLVGMAEAFVFGARAGVDPSVILKVLGGGCAQIRVMDVRGPKVIAGDFAPGFKSIGQASFSPPHIWAMYRSGRAGTRFADTV